MGSSNKLGDPFLFPQPTHHTFIILFSYKKIIPFKCNNTLNRKEVAQIRVLLYGLTLRDHLLLPDMQVIAYDDWSEVEHTLLMTEPDMVVIHEKLARDALSWLSLQAPTVPIIVVVAELSTPITRYWTALGASKVTALHNWELALRERDANDVTAPRVESDGFYPHLSQPSSDAIIFAVAGIYSGVGVTHTALSLAHYLAAKERVAVWEAGDNPCFDFLEYSLTGNMNRKVKFDLGRRLTLFKGTAPLEMVEFVTTEYRYLIYDLGCLETEQQRALFNQAHVPIVVASSATWRHVELLQFCRNHARLRQDRWRFVFPHCAEISNELRDCLAGRLAYALPSHPDPTKLEPHHEVIAVLDKLTGMSMPKKSKILGLKLGRYKK